jgi:hypothetical protein
MAISRFAAVAAEVKEDVQRHLHLVRIGATDRDAEWQRVNSYIADVLKDTHVLYAKLARLQGDFQGAELEELQKVSESVLELGEELSHFSKAFYEGRKEMADSDIAYGTMPEEAAPVEAGGEEAPPEGYEVPVEVEVEEEEEAPAPEEEQE